MTYSPDPASLDTELLQQSVRDMDQAYFQQRDLFIRRRFFLGLKEAFAALPKLESIECNFGRDAQSQPGTTTCNLLRDLTPGTSLVADGVLQKALLPMRRAIGTQEDRFEVLREFFNHEHVVLNRVFLEAYYGRLLDPALTQLDSKAFAQLERDTLENNTHPARQTGGSRPRL